jgi:hypothetical protein
MKHIVIIALFLILSAVSLNAAQLENTVENWCGTYFEENGTGYLELPRADFGVGSSGCSFDKYHAQAQERGTAKIALYFSRNRSTAPKWRKFDSHLLEIRGKFYNGKIHNVRLVRDAGV